MENSSIIDRLLVLKKVGDKLQLPTGKAVYLESQNFQARNYAMYRVVNFTAETGELVLLNETGFCDEKSFIISTEVNSRILLSLNITKLNFRVKSPVLFYTTPSDKINTDKPLKSDNTVEDLGNFIRSEVTKPEIPSEEAIKETFSVPFNEIEFKDGKVTFTRFIHMFKKNIEFEIHNIFLRKEYDSIKNFFEKALQTKRVDIEINVEYSGVIINKKSAVSNQILQITDALIEKIEDYVVEKELLANDENVFSVKEKLELLANLFGKAEVREPDWLINKLFLPNKTKHYFHLRFLSGKHLHETSNLRITGKPISFIFLIMDNGNFFLIWETYNTNEATYLWKLNQVETENLTIEIEGFVEQIKWLRQSNKLNYLSTKPKDFKRIEHDYSGEDMGFKKWKKELEEFMLFE